VKPFLDNAYALLSAAENVAQAGQRSSDLVVLISREGGIRMLSNCDWPLEALEREHGSKMAYRVHRDEAGLRVEGRAGTRTCVVQSAPPAEAARQMFRSLTPMVPATSLLPRSASPKTANYIGIAG
jgi:hypothetical protein